MKKKKITGLKIRSARLNDVQTIRKIIATHVGEGLILHKSTSQVIQLLPQFVVAELNGNVIGNCAYKIWPNGDVEIISSAVNTKYHGLGIGTALIGQSLKNAGQIGFKRFFTFTMQPEFFKKLGFTEISKSMVPAKLYADCAGCRKNRSTNPKRIVCDEIALRLILS